MSADLESQSHRETRGLLEESKSYGGLSYYHTSSTAQTLPTTNSEEGSEPSRASTDSLLSLGMETQEVLKETPKTQKKKKKTLWEQVDKTAFQFALRMGILLWFSSLFVLIRTENYKFPDGMWVLVTVLFVSWFPQLDAASVIEKIIQRLLGTFIGAFLGLACGFASLIFTHTHLTQSLFLGTCVFIFNFLIIFVAGQFKVGRVKVIKRFAYATILCSLTFCICIMPFSMDEDPKWARAMYRVLNVVVGCVVGALGSILIVPKSTTDVLYAKASRQVAMAGEAAEAVMNVSSDYFSGRIQVNRLADELLNAPLESELRWRLSSGNSVRSGNSVAPGATDVALKKYEDAIADWRLSKMLFPLVKYDPFNLKFTKDEVVSDAFQTEIARTLARCLRIQTTIVVLDGMVRSDADYEFLPSQLESFSQIGRLVRQMLTVPLDRDSSNAAANILFVKLEETRQAIHRMSHAVATVGDADDLSASGRGGLNDFKKKLLARNSSLFETLHTDAGDEMGRGIPINATGKHDNTLFFLQLTEHMILRSLRLYQAWTHVETLRKRDE